MKVEGLDCQMLLHVMLDWPLFFNSVVSRGARLIEETIMGKDLESEDEEIWQCCCKCAMDQDSALQYPTFLGGSQIPLVI